ncbi:MAG: SPOR domain-containing protein [Pseudomonadota bacterium]
MSNQRGGTLLGLAFGLVVGVLISFGVVWYLNKTPLPFVDKVTRPNGTEAKPGDAPVALPGKPGDKPIGRTGERKFEFYEILEGKKEAAPSPAAAGTPAPPPPVTLDGGTLFLQAGAFQKLADAENLKARLAMLGFEAAILEVEVPEKGTMHRVRIGPYGSAEQMNQARGQLSQNGIPATVVRVKD